MFKLIIVEDEHLIRKWLEIAVDYSALGIQVVGTASHINNNYRYMLFFT